MVHGPLYGLRTVPSGTPVLLASGQPPAVGLGGGVGTAVGLGLGEVVPGVGGAVGVGLPVGLELGVGEASSAAIARSTSVMQARARVRAALPAEPSGAVSYSS